MKLVGSAEQVIRHYMYDASGSITTGGTPQLLLPQHQSRSSFFFENTSSANLVLEFGAARATCSLSGDTISSSFTITNAGFGYTKPPVVRFLGGGQPSATAQYGPPGVNTSYVGAAGPGFPSPLHPAAAHAVLTGGAVSSIVLDDPGDDYVVAPMLFMFNSDLDPIGAAIPTASVGYIITANGSYSVNGTTCPTDQISIFGASTGQTYVCKFMT